MGSGGLRSGRIFIFIALILILGLVFVAFLFRNQLFPQRLTLAPSTPASTEKMVEIVITTQSIQRGSKLTDSVLATIPYPEKDMVSGTFFIDKKDVIGKQAKYDLEARVPLTANLIVSTDVGSYAAFQIPRGMVAISIPITRLTAVSYAPITGDHVNILAAFLFIDLDTSFQTKLPNLTAAVIAPGPPCTEKCQNVLSVTDTISSGGAGSAQGRIEIDANLGTNQPLYIVPSETQRARLTSQTLIQDVIVLHVGNYPLENKAGATSAEPAPTPVAVGAANTTAPAFPEVITLVVKPQDAVILNYLMLAGARLNLTLRSAGDAEIVKTDPVTIEYLMERIDIPNPAKLPFGLQNRLDALVYPRDDATVPATK